MSWLTNFVRPKIQAFIRRQEVPEHFWTKCPSCEHMLFHRDLVENLSVCHHCQHHFRLEVTKRLSQLFDNGEYKTETPPSVTQDPLKFRDSKKYIDRLKEYRQKTQREDSVMVAYGTIEGASVVTVAFDFAFMGGSMGLYAGSAFVHGAKLAVQTGSALLVVCASGGARMQEGILSLMQMPRTTIGVQMVKEAGLPYVVLLSDPTTGGVSASFAMLGDIALAEPGAIIGFAGARVIEETIRQKLPEGFQKSEYLLEHGIVDQVVHRKDLKQTLGRVLKILMRKA